ncbi:LPS export ABC transporter periplasmic protein LptC [Acidobacteria bacterium AH-259-D05]|nr:LPS export ABC transporter periplasmic protein LptC [Acidobacteria bacterium AH-259-D05]
MILSKWLRLALVMCILAGGVAIVWNFLSRRQQVVTIPEAEILAPEISRQSTQFEYTEHRRGRPVFKVDAETSTETVSNVHTLEKVNLAYYDESGEPSDSISGREATYRIDEKQLEFSGDARIQLADGTQLISEQVTADLAQEIARINQDFRFKRGNTQGNGGSLIYRFPQREIKVENGVHLLSFSEARQIEARAFEGTYHLSEQVVKLLSGARISSGDAALKANEIGLFLTEQYQVQRILSSGQAELQAAPLKSFAGEHINIFFDPSSRRLEYLEILGEWEAGVSKRAVYSEQMEAGNSLLEANRIVVVSDHAARDNRLFLKRFAAQGEVLFHSTTLGIQESRSSQMEGEFFEDGEHLRQLHLRGEVSVTRRKGLRRLIEEKLRSTRLQLQLSLSQVLEEAKADGNVELIVNSPDGYRRLVAREFIEVNYEEGVPKRIVSKGDCQMESADAEGRDLLQTPLLVMHYQRGILDNIVAEQGVRLESHRRGKSHYTSSDRLEIFYHNGVMEQVVQSGNFHFWENDPATLELRSDQAVFDPAIERIVATGEELPVLRFVSANGSANESIVETVAQRFELDRKTSEVFAEGQVRSLLREKNDSTIITSGRMQADSKSAWVQYWMNPRIVQQSNSISGKIVKYNHRDQQLVVEGEVESSIIRGDPVNGKRYWIEAESLVYNRQTLRARYRGQVQLKTDDLILVAPYMDVVFATMDTDQLQEIVAWGGVQISQGDRRAEGDRAVHYPSENKVVLMGDPARVVETQRGKVIGRRLTFYIGDEKLLVEGRSTPEKP